MANPLPEEAGVPREARPVRRTKGPQQRKGSGREPGDGDAYPAQATQEAMAERRHRDTAHAIGGKLAQAQMGSCGVLSGRTAKAVSSGDSLDWIPPCSRRPPRSRP